MRNITPIIFTQSKSGRQTFPTPNNHIDEFNLTECIDSKYLRKDLNLPEVSEPQIARHFVNLSTIFAELVMLHLKKIAFKIPKKFFM